MTIFEEVEKLNLPIGQYAVVGSGVMSAYGIRQHGDVDLIITPDLFDILKDSGWELSKNKKNVIKSGNYEADIDYKYGEYNPNPKELIETAEIINGIPFIKLDEVIKFKKALNRDKDQDDIKLINNYLMNESF